MLVRSAFWILALQILSSVSSSKQWPMTSVLSADDRSGLRQDSFASTEKTPNEPLNAELLAEDRIQAIASHSHSSGALQNTFTLHARDLTSSWTPPLSTRGRYIVDADGKRFRLVAGNWHGASGTYLGRGDIDDPANHHAGEQAFETPLCLDRVPVDDLVQSFLDLGITAIRLPFSNEMIHSTSSVPDSALRANPQFRGMTPLQIYDACIEALTKRGLAVILNNHTVKSIWCCGVDVNARWNGAQTDQAWQDDWVFMMKRYKTNPRVVGAELYNEVRRDFLADPTWGSGSSTDWWNASMVAGTRIAREANPDALLIVEGINFVGIPSKFTAHSRPELQPVGQISHAYPVLDKLVYSSHFYAYTGPNATGAAITDDPLYRDLSPDNLDEIVRQLAFFVSNDTPARHYTAPVWISEFGSAGRQDFLSADRSWWFNFTGLLNKYDADFALWPLVGWQENGRGDGWAMHMFDSNGQRLSILDPGDWRLPGLQTIVNASSTSAIKQGTVNRTDPTFVQLYTEQGSVQQSNRLTADIAFLSQPGDVQASCPDGLRLTGISSDRTPAGLCTDATFERFLWNASDKSAPYTIITTEVAGSRSPDWASGLTKFQCPPSAHITGYSYSDGRLASIVCAQQSRDPLSALASATSTPVTDLKQTGHRTVFFGDKVRVADDRGQWYAFDATAATCQDDELLVGIAFTTAHSDSGRPQALLCQNFQGNNLVVGAASGSSATSALTPSTQVTVLATILTLAICVFAHIRV